MCAASESNQAASVFGSQPLATIIGHIWPQSLTLPLSGCFLCGMCWLRECISEGGVIPSTASKNINARHACRGRTYQCLIRPQDSDASPSASVDAHTAEQTGSKSFTGSLS